MSALWSPLSPPREAQPSAPERGDGQRRPALRPVTPPHRRLARVPFVLVLIGIVGAGMAGLLLLNTSLQDQAFEVRTVQRRATELAYTQAGLEEQADVLAAPEVLARRASALGMRANPLPAFLVLPSGKIIGKSHQVRGTEVPSLWVKTPAEVAAELQAAAAARAQESGAAVAAQQTAQALAAERAAAASVAQKAADAAVKRKAPNAAALQKLAATARQQAAAAAAAAVKATAAAAQNIRRAAEAQAKIPAAVGQQVGGTR